MSVEKLQKSIKDLKIALGIDSPTWKQIEPHLLDNYRVAENMLVSQGFPLVEAHAMVYGHDDITNYEPNENAMSKDANMWKQIDQWRDDAKDSVNHIYATSVRSVTTLTKLTADTTMAMAAMANAGATMPPQPAVAAYTAKQYNDSVKEASESFKPVEQILAPLGNLGLLVAESSIDAVTTPIVVLLDTITASVKAIRMLPTI